tara:strand:- start:3080 stop:4084 length:1005 start_codon:yes stop_codon:yes gene_type:complete
MCATIVPKNNLHYPVLLKEILSIISPQNGGTFIDCTFGQGGYSKKILQFPKTKVIAFDRDQNSKLIASRLKRRFKNRFEFFNKKFSEIDDIKTSDQIKGIIFDLGFSYDQIKDPSKGLSFNYKGKLNMKMGLNKYSAQDIIRYSTARELEKIFKYYGEEKHSKLISKKIVDERKYKDLLTEDLVNIINLTKKNYTKKNKSTKVFQALRILVNNEISELILGLSKSCNLISKNGIIAVVAFHSIEDRICKFFFNEISSLKKVSRYLPIKNQNEVSFKLIKKKPIIPSKNEIEKNPPSRSAKLRAVQRLDTSKIDSNFIYEKFKYLLDIENIASKL